MTVRHALIRADASTVAGTGHVVRCRTLAEALIARGWSVTFATRSLPAPLAASLARRGIRSMPLEADVPLADDPARIADAVGAELALVVVDHYDIGAPWLDAARPHARVLMAIDDLGDRPLPVDILLNQNLGASEDAYARHVGPETQILIGPRYALVRDEFHRQRIAGGGRPGTIGRVLVFLSGADPMDVTGRAVDALWSSGVEVDAVVGVAYPHLDALRRRVSGRTDTRVHVDTDAMAALMASADLAIGAPSSASWERCTVGLPAVLVTLADNQIPIEHELVRSGAALGLGWHTAVTSTEIRAAVDALQADPPRVAAMARAASAVTDGLGTERVITEIERRVARKET